MKTKRKKRKYGVRFELFHIISSNKFFVLPFLTLRVFFAQCCCFETNFISMPTSELHTCTYTTLPISISLFMCLCVWVQMHINSDFLSFIRASFKHLWMNQDGERRINCFPACFFQPNEIERNGIVDTLEMCPHRSSDYELSIFMLSLCCAQEEKNHDWIFTLAVGIRK